MGGAYDENYLTRLTSNGTALSCLEAPRTKAEHLDMVGQLISLKNPYFENKLQLMSLFALHRWTALVYSVFFCAREGLPSDSRSCLNMWTAMKSNLSRYFFFGMLWKYLSALIQLRIAMHLCDNLVSKHPSALVTPSRLVIDDLISAEMQHNQLIIVVNAVVYLSSDKTPLGLVSSAQADDEESPAHDTRTNIYLIMAMN